MGRAAVEVTGLRELVAELRGPRWREVNRELRGHARVIASDLKPLIERAVASSAAPQAQQMAATVRVHSDRVPVLVVGKVNPRLAGFRRRGESAKSTKLRRGSLARGVLYGPLGGRRDTPAAEDYYHVPRSQTAGPLGVALRDNGPIMARAADLYLRAFMGTLRAHGYQVR